MSHPRPPNPCRKAPTERSQIRGSNIQQFCKGIIQNHSEGKHPLNNLAMPFNFQAPPNNKPPIPFNQNNKPPIPIHQNNEEISFFIAPPCTSLFS